MKHFIMTAALLVLVATAAFTRGSDEQKVLDEMIREHGLLAMDTNVIIASQDDAYASFALYDEHGNLLGFVEGLDHLNEAEIKRITDAERVEKIAARGSILISDSDRAAVLLADHICDFRYLPSTVAVTAGVSAIGVLTMTVEYDVGELCDTWRKERAAQLNLSESN